MVPGPAQLGAKMDVEPHHDPGEARRHQPETAVFHQRDAAGFEIGRINRVVDVLVGVEIGKAHIVRTAGRENLPGAALNRDGQVRSQGRSPEASRPYSPVVELRQGVAGVHRRHIMAFLAAPPLARQAQPRRAGPDGRVQPKRS